MSQQRYTPEFKDEAVRQVTEKGDIFEYVEMFYNRTRRHSHLGGVSPEAFEAASNHRL